MKKKFTLILLLLLVMPLLLVACGGDDDKDGGDDDKLTADHAEKALEATFKGDFDTADDYICATELDKARASAEGQTPPDGLEVDASCEAAGENMTCTLKITQPVEGAEASVIDVPATTFSIVDNKLCTEVAEATEAP